VEKVSSARASGLQNEAMRKARWDLVLFATLSPQIRDRLTGTFQDGQSKELGMSFTDMADIAVRSPDMCKRILKVVGLVLDEVFLLAKAGESDASGVQQRVMEGFLPQLRALGRLCTGRRVHADRGNFR